MPRLEAKTGADKAPDNAYSADNQAEAERAGLRLGRSGAGARRSGGGAAGRRARAGGRASA